MANHGSQRQNIISVNISVKYRMYYYRTTWYLLLHVNYKNFINYITLAFLTLCDQAFNPPFLGGKIIELAKFCFMNK